MHGVTNHTKHPLKLKFITNYYSSSGRRHPLLKKKEIYIHQKSCFTFLLYKDFLEFSSFSSTKGNLLRTKWFKGRIVTVLGWWPSGLPFSVFLSFCIIICVLVLCVSLELFYWWFDLDLFIGFPPCLCPLCLPLCVCAYACTCASFHSVMFICFPSPSRLPSFSLSLMFPRSL